MENVSTIILNISIAIIASIITAVLSLRVFYKQKFWEYKIKTYIELINSLYLLKRDITESINSTMPQLESKNECKFHSKWKQLIEDFKEQKDIGSFVLSKKTESILSELLKKISVIENSTGSDFKYLDAIENCIEEIKKSSKRDLKINVFNKK